MSISQTLSENRRFDARIILRESFKGVTCKEYYRPMTLINVDAKIFKYMNKSKEE